MHTRNAILLCLEMHFEGGLASLCKTLADNCIHANDQNLKNNNNCYYYYFIMVHL